MTREEIKKIVMEEISNQLAPSTEVTEAADLESDLGADSLDKVEIAMAMEEKFNISIDDERAESVHTVGDIIDLVEKVVAENTKAE